MVRRRGRFRCAVAAGRWWPRWVERIAEQFGDAAAGWAPLVGRVDNARPVWRDTWIALRGGSRVARPFALPDERQLRLAIDDVVSDGVDVEVVGPAVSVAENHLGLVDRDAGPTAAGTAWLS